jgi:hypothetical protein
MDIREQFVGAWRLVSFESRSTNGSVRHPFGAEATGLIQWGASGVFSAQIAPAGEGASGDPAQYVAYFGTWEVDESAGEVVHHVEGAFNAPLRGTDQRRGFAFKGRRLTLLPPPAMANGETVTSEVTWEKC